MSDLFDQLDKVINDIKNIKIEDVKENKMIRNDEFLCSSCDSPNMFKDDLGYECRDCGVVGDIIVEEGAEWRYYGVNDTRGYNPTRTGNIINPLLPKSSMGTFIGGNKYSNIKRLHTWKSMPSSERSLWLIFKKITRLLQNSDIPNKIVEQTKCYYKMITENEDKLKGVLTRGPIREGLIAACIYVSCKENRVPKNAGEIAALCNIDENLVTKGLKKFVEIEKRKKLNINNKQTEPTEFINIYCNKLNLPSDVKKLCIIICERSHKLGILKNNTPPSIAGGIVFLILMKLNIKVPKNKLINIIKISEVTLNKTYKKLNNCSEYLFIGFEKIL
jgi:transcription initiation factor TFIIB